MHIFFKKNIVSEDIRVTVEAKEKNLEVEAFLKYIENFKIDSIVYKINKKGEIHQIPIAEILWIEVFGDYSTIHALDEEIIVRRTLQSIESELPSDLFIRVSRNTMINIKAVRKVTSSFSGMKCAILKNNQSVIISRSFWKKFKERLISDR